MFMKSVYTQNPIDYAIVQNNQSDNEQLLRLCLKCRSNEYKTDDEYMAGVLHWTLWHGDVTLIEHILKRCELDNERFNKILNTNKEQYINDINKNNHAQQALNNLGFTWE